MAKYKSAHGKRDNDRFAKLHGKKTRSQWAQEKKIAKAEKYGVDTTAMKAKLEKLPNAK